jgi:hypothetical protein
MIARYKRWLRRSTVPDRITRLDLRSNAGRMTWYAGAMKQITASMLNVQQASNEANVKIRLWQGAYLSASWDVDWSFPKAPDFSR